MMCLERFVKMYNEIKIEQFIENSEMKIYHYTSPSAFKNIIEKEQLRFTDKLYLNDKSEGVYSLQVCFENIDKIAKHWEQEPKKKLETELEKRIGHFAEYFYKKMFNMYQCSFSCDGDNLCLWNYYSKDAEIQGYNLQFDSATLNSSLNLDPKKGRLPEFIHGCVIYDKKKQIKIIRKIAMEFYDFWQKENGDYNDLDMIIEYFIDKILVIGTFFKDEHFSMEKEYRFAIKIYLDEDRKYHTINDEPRFFEKSGLFIPYIDINFELGDLLSVCVSPTIDAVRAKDSIMRIAAKYPNLKNEDNIRFSVIPIRY